jgi:predicted ATPase
MQWRGGAYVQRGDYELGYTLAKKGNDFWTSSGGRICTAMFRGWVVLGLQGLGRCDEAIKVNLENIAHCRKTGDRYMEPECVRLQGELTLEADQGDAEAAERLFKEAIAIAQAHGAKSWELRAATSFAQLLCARARPREAVACLEPVLNWFSEGLKTEDLRQARDLLDSIH